MASPLVSVIMPVHNVRPWLTDSLESVRRQTYGPENIEILAVDDCSTDGSWAELERLAAGFPAFRAKRLPQNSGSAARPRNVGLDSATGTYVFFLDADDYLGDDAIRRMVEVAERESSDIVLGRVAAPPGQENRSLSSVFARSLDRATLFDSPVYNSLGPWKLFNRSLIESHRLRFPTIPRWDDVVFTNQCYLAAGNISVVADYDCYFLRSREDGSSISQQRAEYEPRIAVATDLVAAVRRRYPPGPKRDHLVRQHVRMSILPILGRHWLEELPASEQEAAFAAVGALLRTCVSGDAGDGVSARLHPRWRLHAHLIARGLLEPFREALHGFLYAEAPMAVADGEVPNQDQA